MVNMAGVASNTRATEGADWTEFGAAVINNKIDKSAVVQTQETPPLTS